MDVSYSRYRVGRPGRCAMTDEMTARALRSSWRASEQALYSVGGGLVAAAAERTGLALGSLSVDQVAGAAFALRQVALQAEEARRARSDLVAAARAEGAD